MSRASKCVIDALNHFTFKPRRHTRWRAENARWLTLLAQRGFDISHVLEHTHEYVRYFSELGAVRLPTLHDDQIAEDAESLVRAELETDFLARLIPDAETWFSAVSDYGVRTEDGVFCAPDDTYECEKTGLIFASDDEFRTVNVRNGTEQWCESAVDAAAFYCDVSNEYYACRYYTCGRTGHGDIICEEIAGDYDYFEHRDGTYYDVPEDDEDDMDDDDKPLAISAYHKGNRAWSYDVANRSTRAFYGFEIEVCFADESDRYDAWEALDNHDVCGECDGSLDDDCGMELITRPMPMQELRTEGNFLQRLMRQLADDDVDAEQDNYGIHITANWGRLTTDHQRRLYQATYKLKPLTVWVAGRETNYAKFTRNSGDKHQAVNERSALAAEFRVFASTLDWNRLMSYVEYVDALTEWTRDPAAPIEGAMAQAAFRRWVTQRADYPHLAARFSAKVKHLEAA